MNFRWLILAVATCLAVTTACSGGEAPSAGSGTPGKPRFAVVPKGTTHVFWKAVEAGARQGGDAAGVEVLWKGPLQENDRAQQIAVVQQFLADGVDGLALAPLDHAALVPVVAQARARNIPVVVFDSDLDGKPGVDFASFVATDNAAGGRQAGTELARLLGGKGKVVLLRYQVGSASTEAREQGFLEAARAAGLEVTVDNRYAGATVGEAKTTALNLLDELKDAQGVFCSNEPTTAGMLLALEQAGLAGKLRFVGFDASPPIVAALSAGKLDAIVVQDPRKMGRLSVELLAKLKRGEPVEPLVDTGAVLVTKDTMTSPDVAPLLQ